MSEGKPAPKDAGRRRFLAGAVAVAATAPSLPAAAAGSAAGPCTAAASASESFFGKHQGGIATPMQRFTYFMAFDMVSSERRALIALLKDWTAAAAVMTRAHPHLDSPLGADAVADESGETIGLSASRLTITFGFGPGLFEQQGVDRYGIASRRPEALTDLPRFTGDQLIAERSGGDLSVQACADDPQVAQHALRRLVRLASGIAVIRWAQTGYQGGFKASETPRNQMGFKDGTINISGKDKAAMERFVWVGSEGPTWMRDGSYMVIRPTRIALEHWDKMKQSFQEQTIGRRKDSGAPIGHAHENDELDFDAVDAEGNPRMAENAHARLAAPQTNGGAQILRRAYSYDNGVAHIAERWPPWRQAVTFDAGLLFQCYQRDPRTGFSKIFENMAKFDMLNQFTTQIGSGLFACPPGVRLGSYIGQGLFE